MESDCINKSMKQRNRKKNFKPVLNTNPKSNKANQNFQTENLQTTKQTYFSKSKTQKSKSKQNVQKTTNLQLQNR